MTKRILILDEEALVLVADKDIVHQVDANRGELTRSEFVNLLIQSQLRRSTRQYVSREEFYHFAQEIKDTLRNLLEFFLSWKIPAASLEQEGNLQNWLHKVESIDEAVSEAGSPDDPPEETTP
ncbi:MAG: hypothetical protein ABID87_06855 [Chloroflexota bacterium]